MKAFVKKMLVIVYSEFEGCSVIRSRRQVLPNGDTLPLKSDLK